jgi:hypothetical protein
MREAHFDCRPLPVGLHFEKSLPDIHENQVRMSGNVPVRSDVSA